MTPDQSLRAHLTALLEGGQAHLKLQDELRTFPVKHAALRAEAVPYTAWQLLEHIRIAQHDILEFSRDPNHVSPPWPDGYWPPEESPQSPAEWGQSIARVLADLDAMKNLLNDPATDLHAKIHWGDGQTVLREAMLVAGHNAYHLGQLVLLRRMLEEA